MAETEKPMARLAMRREGTFWNAYYAETDTLVSAIFLGSIQWGLVSENTVRRKDFHVLMMGCMSDLIEEMTGSYPKWGPTLPAETRRDQG